MNKYINRIISVIVLLILPAAAFSQVEKTEGKVVNVNKLDIIYHEENDEYEEVVIDNPQDDEGVFKGPFAPKETEEDENLLSAEKMYRPQSHDDGVDSEFDILYASMDNEVIHYSTTAELPQSQVIHLIDKEKNRKFCFPTPSISRMSSHFGGRKKRWHYGVDLAMPTGEPVYAAFDGIVRISKLNKSYGNLVVIRHFNGLETYYAHLSERDVNPGDTVVAGTVIGLCGNTGRSFGSHLHFEIRYMGKAMNPEYVVDCQNHCLLSDEIVLTPTFFQKVGSSHASPTPAQLAKVNRKAGTAANDASTTAKNQPKSEAKPARNMQTTNKQTTTKPKTQAQYYKVRSGDTLSKIAQRNGTTVKRLCQLNGIKETSILRIGQRIRVR